jgi:hypothetical protein
VSAHSEIENPILASRDSYRPGRNIELIHKTTFLSMQLEEALVTEI